MRRKKEHKEIKHFNAKFLATLLLGLAGAYAPVIIWGGEAIIFGMGLGLAGASLGLLVFDLV